MNLRAVAAIVLNQVVGKGQSLSDALAAQLTSIKTDRDKAFLKALCYGVCRRYFYLDAIAAELLQKPFKSTDQDLHALILIGLYQLIDMRVGDHAAVSETVAATTVLKKNWAKGLVNAVLRNYQRKAETINKKLNNNLIALYAHPGWLIEKIKQDWPEQWQSILQANNEHPPLALRVNQQKISRVDYQKKLTSENENIAATAAGIVLSTPQEVTALPGFSQGEVSVQDGGAQLAAELLMLSPGMRVLDACAAPGGKTTHILEIESNLELIAIDDDEKRLNTVKENLQRLQLKATCLCADAGDIKKWWDGKPFDRILLDVPCSASGVIRRHPDIKLLRRATDINKLAKEQKRLLNALWTTLTTNGILLYSTCSVFKTENSLLIEDFLQQHPDAREEKITASWGETCPVGRQILPGKSGMDGFYYARLRKINKI